MGCKNHLGTEIEAPGSQPILFPLHTAMIVRVTSPGRGHAIAYFPELPQKGDYMTFSEGGTLKPGIYSVHHREFFPGQEHVVVHMDLERRAGSR